MAMRFGRRPEDLGGMGESYFRLLAKDAGLVANASTDDKAGWDFEVEFPNPVIMDYRSQSKPVFRVQVKATMGVSSSVSMTFSSVLSLIQFAGPAFVLLYRFGDGAAPTDAYLLHIDQMRGMDILRTLRSREVAEPDFKVNRAKTTIKFDDALRLISADGAELRRSLEASLGGSYLTYLESKTKWLRGIEVDSTLHRFNIIFEDEAAVQGMADCFLGIEREFRVRSAHYMAPLGIPDREVVHTTEFYPTTVKPIEENLQRAVIRVRTSEYGRFYEFKATIFSVPEHLPKKFAAMRFHTALFDLIFRLETRSIEFQAVNLADDALRATVSELRGFVAYMAEALEHDLTIFEVIPDDGSAPLRSQLGTGSPSVSADFDAIHTAVEAVYLKLAALGLTNELIRPADMFEKPGHFAFFAHIGKDYEPPLSFEFETDDDVKEHADVTIFNLSINLAGKTVLCFAAFFGSVEMLSGRRLLGRFGRSEYLGEVIVPADHDLDAALKIQGEKHKDDLRKRGFAVL